MGEAKEDGMIVYSWTTFASSSVVDERIHYHGVRFLDLLVRLRSCFHIV